MSKRPFRAAADLVDRFDTLEGSKSEVRREALRGYLDESQRRSDAGRVTDTASTACAQCGEVATDEHVYCPDWGDDAANRLVCEWMTDAVRAVVSVRDAAGERLQQTCSTAAKPEDPRTAPTERGRKTRRPRKTA